MLKILHTADWQIGKPFGQFDPDDALFLSEARIQCVENIARLASEHSVDAVVVAGDVFDAQTVADKTVRRLFNALKAFDGPWIMIPGNHDAALVESVWTQAHRMGIIPEDVVVCTQAEPLYFEDLQLSILPAPLTQRHTYQDLTAWFDHATTPDGFYRVGVAHGSVTGLLDSDIDAANPIDPQRAEKAHLSYLALGDWHGMMQINDRTWYSGTPEPDRFRNNESGQVLLVELASPTAIPVVTPLRSGQFQWTAHAFTLNIESDMDALLHWLEGLDAHAVVDLNLTGSVTIEAYQRIAQATGQAQGVARAFDVSMHELRIMPSEQDIVQLAADGYVGAVIQELREEQEVPPSSPQNDEHPQTARDALVILADLLAQGKHEEHH
ncbi:hypothetical protein LMG33818_001287 [Halomonadaceae bacterium LMG 33818]|uniref:metallophosphoesterase family protein n=1 Tax=Cernens ardua TaxID=3402176 RepID=UPI003EDBE966